MTGITLKGFKYPLTDRDIFIGTSLCISNELVEEEGRITLSDGVLITVNFTSKKTSHSAFILMDDIIMELLDWFKMNKLDI